VVPQTQLGAIVLRNRPVPLRWRLTKRPGARESQQVTLRTALERIRETLEPGGSVVIADYVQSGVRRLWSVWLGREDSLIVTCWVCQPGTEWSRETSFAVDAGSVTVLEGLLQVRRGLRL
jgi:hypothetical protein